LLLFLGQLRTFSVPRTVGTEKSKIDTGSAHVLSWEKVGSGCREKVREVREAMLDYSGDQKWGRGKTEQTTRSGGSWEDALRLGEFQGIFYLSVEGTRNSDKERIF
jgi:hypothetical protein